MVIKENNNKKLRHDVRMSEFFIAILLSKWIIQAFFGMDNHSFP